jgi:hypothetical protein
MFPITLAASLLLARFTLAATTAVDYCEDLDDVIDICSASTANFLSLAPTDQASCLCGTALGTISWGPTLFANLATACARTAAPSIASDASGLEGFCASYYKGAAGVTTPATTHAGPTTTTPSTSGTTTAVDYCEDLSDVIDICSESTSNFLSLAPTQQASCICGTALGTIPWGPMTFDNLAAACAKTAAPSLASDVSALEGFCATNYNGASSAKVTSTATSVPTTRASVSSNPVSSAEEI